MKFGKPEVSVVVGAYNAGEDLQPALESILGQEGIELELIVVDDGSTDDTGGNLEEMARNDSRLRVIHQENLGLTAALIRARPAAVPAGRYIPITNGFSRRIATPCLPNDCIATPCNSRLLPVVAPCPATGMEHSPSSKPTRDGYNT